MQAYTTAMFWSRAYLNINGRTRAKLTSAAVSCLQGTVKNAGCNLYAETHSQLSGVSATKKSADIAHTSRGWANLWNSADNVRTREVTEGARAHSNVFFQIRYQWKDLDGGQEILGRGRWEFLV